MQAVAGLRAVLLVCLAALQGSHCATGCRKAPSAQSGWCGLPDQLSNFQGSFACATAVKVGKPSSVEDLLQLVQDYGRVKGAGVGHSWWQQQFCAGSNSSAVNIVLTELRDTLQLITSTSYSKNQSSAFPIQIDEENQLVTVAAGVPQRILLDYLAAYTSSQQPNGWTLAAFSWYIDQTIGGAVSTGTHGSTLKYGSLSSQVVAIDVALANGTLATVTAESHPHIFRALQVSVGRLGILVRLVLRMVPNTPVTRTLIKSDFGGLADQVKATQEVYNAALASKDAAAVAAALKRLDETQVFWYVPTDEAWRVDYQKLDEAQYPTKASAPSSGTVAVADLGPGIQEDASKPSAALAYAQAVHAAQIPNPAINLDPTGWSNTFGHIIERLVKSGTYPARLAYLSEDADSSKYQQNLAPYDQYELIVPLTSAGTCLELVHKAVQDNNWGSAFRTPGLIRFLSQEQAYLSTANDESHMYVNLEDYLGRPGHPNEVLQKVVSLFRSSCGARLHWGKAGWPEHAACFDGATEYKSTWCHFGCAVHELDPGGKFQSLASDIWRWNMTLNGDVVGPSSCCTSAGFSDECQCSSTSACAEA